MKQKAVIAFIFFTVLLSPAFSLADGTVMIVNKDVSLSALSADDVRQIFLGHKTIWDNGDKIIFVVQDRTKTADAFLKTYIQKTASQYDTYWKKQVFTGKGKAPKTFSSDRELAEFVAHTPGAIGYVSSGADTGTAKIITVQ